MNDILEKIATTPNIVAVYDARTELSPLFAQFFPEKKENVVKIGYFEGADNTPIQLRVADMNDKSLVRKAKTASLKEHGMLYFQDSHNTDAETLLEFDKVKDSKAEDPNVQSLLEKLWDNQADLIAGGNVTKEILRCQLMSYGKIAVNDNGVIKEIDYGVSTDHKVTLAGVEKWSDISSDIPTYIETWQDIILNDTGVTPNFAVCTSETMKNIRKNTAVIALTKQLNPTLTVLSKTKILEALYTEYNLTIFVYDDMYQKPDGTKEKLFANNVFTMFNISVNPGRTIMGKSPDELLLNEKNLDISMVENMVLYSKMSDNPVGKLTKLSMLCLPSGEGLNTVFFATVQDEA